MKKILLLLISTQLFFTSPLLAQTATSSSSLSDTVQELRENIQQKVQEKLNEITQAPNPKKAYVGTITEIKDKNLKIDSKTKIYEFTLSEDATFVNQKLQKIKVSDLKVGQDVLVLSLSQDTLVFAKRVLLIDPKTLENKKNVVSGQIADISPTNSVLVLIPGSNKGREMQIKVTAATKIFTRDRKSLKFSDLKKGQKLICIYPDTDNSTYEAQELISL